MFQATAARVWRQLNEAIAAVVGFIDVGRTGVIEYAGVFRVSGNVNYLILNLSRV